ncbi:transposase, fragment (plasmid) [Rhizobium favelukesii]|uniref:Transposase n=1 Tax=Rhizobium favelukesii TaxID=348824 RepID=W6RRN7_9HYPH|nr:transposase, fragment [Rhizobium favelukesii]
MPAERLEMRRVREILRYRFEQGLGHKSIAVRVGAAPSTVRETLRRAAIAELSWPLSDEVSDAVLEAALYKAAGTKTGHRRSPEPDWAQVHRELKRKHMTLQILWDEYISRYPEGYRYSRYCDLYRGWAMKLPVTMRQDHAAGDKLFVDYAGDTVTVIVDRLSGKTRQAHLFVAVLGASSLSFAHARWSETLPDWIECHLLALEAFGGAPALLVPDNAKVAVIKACHFDPQVNRTYAGMAAHYGSAVLPARPRRPRDKERTSRCTLLDLLSANQPGLAATIATADAFCESDVAWRLIQVTMVGSVAVALENAIASELVDGCGADAKLAGDFLAGKHAALAQPFEPGLQPIGSTNEHDLLQRKRLTAPVTMPERIETTGNLLVVVGLQQFVDQRYDRFRGLADHCHGPGTSDCQALRAPSAPAYVHVDLLVDQQRHVFDEETKHAFALDSACMFVVPDARKIGGQRPNPFLRRAIQQ